MIRFGTEVLGGIAVAGAPGCEPDGACACAGLTVINRALESVGRPG